MKKEIIYVNENKKSYNIIIGQNARENTLIVKDSHPNDIWMHFESISSAHIILQSSGDVIPKQYIDQVAFLLFKYKSKAPKNSNVIYTEIKNVKCTTTPGLVYTTNTKVIKFY
jgi:predicted ribosome quality control (RQC) complex YloA/Tae2 family protein